MVEVRKNTDCLRFGDVVVEMNAVPATLEQLVSSVNNVAVLRLGVHGMICIPSECRLGR
jgi:hypothetical protein